MSQDTENTTNKKSNKKRFNWFPLSLTLLMWIAFFVGISTLKSYVNAVIENKDNAFGPLPTYESLENPKSEYLYLGWPKLVAIIVFSITSS